MRKVYAAAAGAVFLLSACSSGISSTYDLTLQRQTRMINSADKVCVLPVRDASNQGITYRGSGAYLQDLIFNQVNQYLKHAFKASSQAQAVSLGCNLVMGAEIKRWSAGTFSAKEVAVQVNTFNQNGASLNSVMLSAKANPVALGTDCLGY